MAKILIVDDSTFMRKILLNILAKEGHKDVLEAVDGDEGVKTYKAKKPDLVLLDIIMDKKDGIQALKEIMAANRHAKVVMVSAVGQEQMVKEALRLGAHDFIVKPFDAKKVAQSVKEALG